VLLLRPAPDHAEGVEVFMQQRATSMAFASGMAAFPGGSVDPTDRLGTDAWLTDAPHDLDEPHERGGAAALPAVTAAAIRETFEECGVLLARRHRRGGSGEPDNETQGPTSGLGSLPLGAVLRASLSEHRLGIAEALGELGLLPHLAQLRYVDRWVTPEGLPKRYDTRFVATAVPPGQQPDNLTTESTRSFWIHPAEALHAYAAGSMDMMEPTWTQLRRLAAATSLEDALRPAGTGVRRNVLTDFDGVIKPWGPGTDEYWAAGPGTA
jgi:8-oxo-dGTP pyrophosphatase MutT (NUDIX family)